MNSSPASDSHEGNICSTSVRVCATTGAHEKVFKQTARTEAGQLEKKCMRER
jgi:hypothetical protein